tara:strand:- start:534 stop:743 length:210 start_codon:yes stop_codon:yes gene_type:complete
MNDKTDYQGVSFSKRDRKFKSTFTYKGITHECGTSNNPREAARLRDITILRLGAPQEKLQVLKPKKEEL